MPSGAPVLNTFFPWGPWTNPFLTISWRCPVELLSSIHSSPGVPGPTLSSLLPGDAQWTSCPQFPFTPRVPGQTLSSLLARDARERSSPLLYTLPPLRTLDQPFLRYYLEIPSGPPALDALSPLGSLDPPGPILAKHKKKVWKIL